MVSVNSKIIWQKDYYDKSLLVISSKMD